MHQQIFKLIILPLVCVLGVGVQGSAQASTFTTFDAPGAVNGTFPSSINPVGAITGSYTDATFVTHGFVRNRDGTFIAPIDAPGTVFTVPVSINPMGAITGPYFDANFVPHGFLRTP